MLHHRTQFENLAFITDNEKSYEIFQIAAAMTEREKRYILFKTCIEPNRKKRNVYGRKIDA